MPNAAELHVGKFNVDKSGQASYRIPVEVPPGIGGQKPVLEIAYDHRRTNGVMGIGWSLSGLSAITRTKAIPAIDGYNGGISYSSTDRLALDGQRLLATSGEYWGSGTIYSTEVTSWRQVIGGATPGVGFTVYQKNGEIWTYGGTPNSCILAGTTSTVRVWALSSIEDLNGNTILFQYTKTPITGGSDTGAYYLSQISYTVRTEAPTLSAQRFVNFNYTTRSDSISSYIAGELVQTNYLLQSITTTIQPPSPASLTTISTYAFSYQQDNNSKQSELSTITITGADGNALPPIQVGWLCTDGLSFSSNSTSSLLPRRFPDTHTFSADVDGDGMTELIQTSPDERETFTLSVLKPKKSWKTDSSTSLISVTKTRKYNNADQIKFIPADVNGDGRTDLVIAFCDRMQNVAFDIYLSTGTAFEYANTYHTSYRWGGEHQQSFHAADLNGDGRTDILRAYADDRNNGNLSFNIFLSDIVGTSGQSTGNLSCACRSVKTSLTYLQQPFNESVFTMDLNGDGIVDVLYAQLIAGSLSVTSFITVGTRSGITFLEQNMQTSLGSIPGGSYYLSPLDINGDGLFDLVLFQSQGSGSSASVFTSMANGGFTPGQTSSLSPANLPMQNGSVFALNGVGGPTVLVLAPNYPPGCSLYVFTSDCLGNFTVSSNITFDHQNPPREFLIGQFSETGNPDLVWIGRGEDELTQNLFMYSSREASPAYVERITDALGGITTIEYSTLCDPTVYSGTVGRVHPKTSVLRFPDHLVPALYPTQEVLGQALWVVSSYGKQTRLMERENNSITEERFGFQYEDGRIDLTGRGWEGFEKVITVNYSTGLHSVETFAQDFPFVGCRTSLKVQAQGNLWKETLTTYTSRVPVTDPTESTIEIFKTAEVLVHYEGGKKDYAVGTTYQYDKYGNCNEEVWQGYITPPSHHELSIPSIPTLTPLNQEEVVYCYRKFQNDILSTGWALGYLLYEKNSANNTDTDITTFATGDLTLSKRTYFPTTYNLQSVGQWDSTQSAYLTTSYTFNSYGNVHTETVPGEQVTTWAYESSYHTFPWTCTTPADMQGNSLTTSYGYDPRFGIEVARQQPNGSVFLSSLDGFGRTVLLQGPAPSGVTPGPLTVTPLVTGNSPSLFTGAQGVTIETTQYDNQGCYLTILKTSFSFSTQGNDEWHTVRCLDAQGKERQKLTANPDNQATVLTEYAPCGKPSRVSLPFSRGGPEETTLYATFTYDPLGRPLTKTVPCGANGTDTVTTTWQYGAGQTVTCTEGAGTQDSRVTATTTHLFFGTEKIVQVVVPGDDNATTSFTFTRLGLPHGVTDPSGVVSSAQYDSLGRMLHSNDPQQNTTGSGNAFTYAYFQTTGLLQSITDAAGAMRSFTYDNLGRVLKQSLADERTISYTYDTATNGGFLGSVTVTSNAETQSSRVYSRDGYGNIVSEQLTIGGQSYTVLTSFDNNGVAYQRTLPDSTIVKRDYRRGSLTRLRLLNGTTPLFEVKYAGFTPTGQYQNLFSNDLNITYGYNPCGLRYTENVSTSAGQIMNLTYTYDKRLRFTQIADSVAPPAMQTWSYSYANDRLISATLPRISTTPLSYSYTNSGDFITKEGNSFIYRNHFPISITNTASVYSATADACGRTKTASFNQVSYTYAYDGFGALCSITNSSNLELKNIITDSRGEVLQITDADGTVTTHVCPEYRVKVAGGVTTTTRHIIDAVGPVGSVETVNTTNTVSTFRRDHKGSITHTVVNGEVDTILDYAPYGAVTTRQGTLNGTPAFEAHPWQSAVGLYHFSARYYNPLTGAFITPDPKVAGPWARPGVWNRFAFELNDPINHIDPSGHMPDWLGGLLIGVGAVVAGVAVVAATIVTGGADIPILAAVGAGALSGALIGGGSGAITYAATHQDNYSWKEYGMEFGVNAAAGAIVGAVTPLLPEISALSTLPRLMAAEAALNGFVNLGATAALNGLEGKPINDGLGLAFASGFVLGGVGRGMGSKLDEAFRSFNLGRMFNRFQSRLARAAEANPALVVPERESWQTPLMSVSEQLQRTERRALWRESAEELMKTTKWYELAVSSIANLAATPISLVQAYGVEKYENG